MNESSDSAREGLTERLDELIKRVSDRRKESIRRSLERPLKLEILRACLMVAFILLDMIFLPIAVFEIFGHDLLFISIPFVIPLIWIEYKVYNHFFH